jgi:hypothetical protein
LRCYTGGMKPKASIPLNIKLAKGIWERVEKFRFKRSLQTEVQAREDR